MTGRELEAAAPTALETQAGAAVSGAAAVAEVQTAAVLAMRKPRDPQRAWEGIRQACERFKFADEATYSYPRGDTEVYGASVKLAREMARCWGNIQYGIRILSRSRREVQVEGWAWDVETNTRNASEAKFSPMVQRWEKGELLWVLADERDLRELVNRHGAMACRNAILNVLPSDLSESAVALCRSTVKNNAAGRLEDDREGTLRRMLKAWEELGVSKAMLEHRIGTKWDEATAAHLADLQALGQSIRDDQTTVAHHFPEVSK